jgi:hypothetical protein
LQQFINLTSGDSGKVLRIVRMPSKLPLQQTNFGSEYLTWCETKSRVYCKGEDASLIKLLRWNDISTTHSVQWWTPILHGFGAFINVRAGSLLVMVAASPHTYSEGQNCFNVLNVCNKTKITWEPSKLES